ncbi:uncharacterized protein RAG0_02306 [Rhynchosporium agropyri]|uniref:Uncharacterized protein n=1 Tax=Rhynchosporium agropyri TaxID=914238 RepID=A0A1E1K0Y8_9HELO|nr:uncharacterized protein RAG0_02306 [Rhynchosporium agropyri]
MTEKVLQPRTLKYGYNDTRKRILYWNPMNPFLSLTNTANLKHLFSESLQIAPAAPRDGRGEVDILTIIREDECAIAVEKLIADKDLGTELLDKGCSCKNVVVLEGSRPTIRSAARARATTGRKVASVGEHIGGKIWLSFGVTRLKSDYGAWCKYEEKKIDPENRFRFPMRQGTKTSVIAISIPGDGNADAHINVFMPSTPDRLVNRPRAMVFQLLFWKSRIRLVTRIENHLQRPQEGDMLQRFYPYGDKTRKKVALRISTSNLKIRARSRVIRGNDSSRLLTKGGGLHL